MSKVLISLFVLFGINSILHAQNVDLVLNIADLRYEQKDYYGSLNYYQKAIELDSNNVDVLFKYARNLSAVNNHPKASRYYYKAYLLRGSEVYPTLPFLLAESYRSSGEYRKARRYYSKAIQPYRRERNSYWYKRINQSKESARWASRQNGKEIQASNMGGMVNSNYSDFAAMVHENQFYFSSLIADSVKGNGQIEDRHYFSRIYFKSVEDEADAMALKIGSDSKELNNKHLANPFVYQGLLYFSACDTNYQCQIWQAKIVDHSIRKAELLNKNINLPNTNNTQASLATIDKQTYLFFVSDRERGLGGLDIWVAKKESFGFDEPINLGPNINTPDNDITPYFSMLSQKLYFSSNWHSGYGGYDIFYAQKDKLSYTKPKNLGKGINSHADDYYFYPQEHTALLTSNRSTGNSEKSKSCCNDLFEVQFEEEIIAADSSVEEVAVSVEVLNKYLPLDLYFHNDTPDPNSKDSTTKSNYIELAKDYLAMEQEYIQLYSEIIPAKQVEESSLALNTFFEEEVNNGMEELEEFVPLLLKELESGSQIELSIKGFASGVSKSDYNLNLTKRRIESLINYLKIALNGAFNAYLDGTAPNGGSLKINKVPYGDFAIKQRFNEEDKINAVYSPLAAKQRKIELIGITNSSDNSQLNMEEQPIAKFNTEQYDLGQIANGTLIKRFFKLENKGKGELKIYNINSNCDCASIDYEETLAPGESQKLWLEIDTKALGGSSNIQFTVVSNSNPNILNLNVDFEVIEE